MEMEMDGRTGDRDDGAGVCQCAPRPRSVSIVYACVYMCRSAAPGQGRPAGRAARVSCPSLLAEGGGASYDWGLSERLAGGWWWRSMDGRTPTAAVRGLGRRGIGGRGADHERVGGLGRRRAAGLLLRCTLPDRGPGKKMVADRLSTCGRTVAVPVPSVYFFTPMHV